MTVLVTEHEMYERLASHGTRLVDVSRDVDANGKRELFILPIPRHALTEEDLDLIIGHASVLGVHRCWIENRGMVELPGLVPFGATATVDCHLCGWTMQNSSTDFWNRVAMTNQFPGSCAACGHSILTWHVSDQDSKTTCSGMADVPDEWSDHWHSGDPDENTTAEELSGEIPDCVLDELELSDDDDLELE